MQAAYLNGAGKIPASTHLEKSAYIAVAQPEALVFSIYMRLCNVTHRQKERQQREQMSPHLIYIALCVLTTPDRETLQIMG